MKKASEYRRRAAECRQHAATIAPGGQRDRLLEVAANWDRLAEDRAVLIRHYPKLALAGERDEERGREIRS